MGVAINKIIGGYERAFAARLGVLSACTFWKGRTALRAILEALEIGEGDEVIVPAFTCVVVPNAVRFVGATPVFVDIAPGSYNLDPSAVERAITPRCRAILVQHTFGIPADLDRLTEIAERHRVPTIEDCAHAIGSTYSGRPLGSFGFAAFFSSQWSKPYTTGLGGIAVTSDAKTAERLFDLQSRYQDPPLGQVVRLGVQYQVYKRLFGPRLYWTAVATLKHLSKLKLFVGSSGDEELDSANPPDLSWRMSAFQARVGLEQLGSLSENLGHRNLLADFYSEFLTSRGWQGIEGVPAQASCTLLRYPVRVSNKWVVLQQAADARVELGSWFESVLHPVRTSLGRFGYQEGSCPIAEQTADEVINLPLHSRVSIEEAGRIVSFVNDVSKTPPSVVTCA
jgi:dTDP-4-amino-4,6-dideoxygalactose transaminase